MSSYSCETAVADKGADIRLFTALIALVILSACGTAASDAQSDRRAAPSYRNPTPGREIALQVRGMHLAKVRRNLVYTRAGRRAWKLDVYRPRRAPASARLPAVLFVHGTTSDANAKDWGLYVGWGQLAAAHGLAGVTFSHRSDDFGTSAADAVADVAAAIRYVRANAARLGVDGARLCVAAYSGGVPYGLTAALAVPAPAIRCLVAYYGPLDLGVEGTSSLTPEEAKAYSPLERLRADPTAFPPTFVAKAGRDSTSINSSIDNFVAAAKEVGAPVTATTHPTGLHGFDARNRDATSRRIIKETLVFVRARLRE